MRGRPQKRGPAGPIVIACKTRFGGRKQYVMHTRDAVGWAKGIFTPLGDDRVEKKFYQKSKTKKNWTFRKVSRFRCDVGAIDQIGTFG